jgi:hypothetical protein
MTEDVGEIRFYRRPIPSRAAISRSPILIRRALTV